MIVSIAEKLHFFRRPSICAKGPAVVCRGLGCKQDLEQLMASVEAFENALTRRRRILKINGGEEASEAAWGLAFVRAHVARF